jgi:branched-chain amino acid transport system ATP-binding protein
MSAIVVEQHAQKILGVTDNALILDRGAIVHASSSRALIEDPAALEQHLGVTAKKKPTRSISH